MKIKSLALFILLVALTASAQYNVSYFNQGFLQQQNAAQDLAWLGIGGTNKTGSGTVTNFTATGFPPLFSSAVSTPTTYPHLAFTAIPQGSNLVFASPDGVTGIPTFRRLTSNDLPGSGGSGTVTSFSSGDLPPIFTTSVATPTTTPALSYSLSGQSANTVFAGPDGGGAGFPAFRSLSESDIPDLSDTYLPLAGGTMTGTINLSAGGVNFGSSPMFQDGTGNITVRNGTGTAPQSFTLYRSFTDASNYRKGMLYWSGNDFYVATKAAGTGLSSGNLVLEADGMHSIRFRINGTDLWNMDSSGAVVPLLDDSYDIGDVTTPRRVRTVYAVNFVGSGSLLSDVVLSITNSSLNVDPTRITLVGTSNTPIPSIKSISAGSGVTLTDQLTNVEISASGGGGSSTNSVDYYMTNLTSYANSSNYFIDFSFPSATLTSATNVIAFNYSTNWSLANTSRVCSVYIAPTNFGRIVTFTGAATNWHLQPTISFVPLGYGAKLKFSQFGPGETNIVMTPFIDATLQTSNLTANFNPTNAFPTSGIIGTKLWLDASKGAYQDEWLTAPAGEGQVVRGWLEQSGTITAVTNMSTTAMNLTYHTPQLGPFNVPCMSVYPGQSASTCWLEGATISTLAQPIWGFIMYCGRSGGVVVDSTSGGRFAINPAEMGQVSSFFTGSGIQYTAAKNYTWTLVACEANGLNSVMRTNGVQAVSGNAGLGLPAKWIVFGDSSHGTMIGSYNVAEILILATNISNTQLTNVESYFYRKYPFWNPPTLQ